MTTTIIDGRKIRNDILENVKTGIAALSFQPVFCDVLVGDDPVSAQYIAMKAKNAESVGIHFHHAEFPKEITTEELMEEIKKLNEIPNMCGIIVQLPLPPHIDKQKVTDMITPHLDVDCLGAKAAEIFYGGDVSIGFPTALACMAILDSLNISFENKKIVVIGQGELVGKPVTHLFRMRGLPVEIVTRSTANKEELIKQADVIVSGTGAGKFITGGMIQEGAIIVDAGTSESSGGPSDVRTSIVGDVDLESVTGVAGFVSPVPGGVGPVTVAMLLNNVYRVASQIK